MLGSEARGNKAKEMYYSLLSLCFIPPSLATKYIGIGLFSKNLQPCDIDFCDFSQTHEKSQPLGNFWDGLLFPRQLIRGNSFTGSLEVLPTPALVIDYN